MQVFDDGLVRQDIIRAVLLPCDKQEERPGVVCADGAQELQILGFYVGPEVVFVVPSLLRGKRSGEVIGP